MDWIDNESIRRCSPLFADELVWREALQRLKASPKIVGVDEVVEMSAQLIVLVVVEALDGCVLDGPVHPLDLTVRPRMACRVIQARFAVSASHCRKAIRRRRQEPRRPPQ